MRAYSPDSTMFLAYHRLRGLVNCPKGADQKLIENGMPISVFLAESVDLSGVGHCRRIACKKNKVRSS